MRQLDVGQVTKLEATDVSLPVGRTAVLACGEGHVGDLAVVYFVIDAAKNELSIRFVPPFSLEKASLVVGHHAKLLRLLAVLALEPVLCKAGGIDNYKIKDVSTFFVGLDWAEAAVSW